MGERDASGAGGWTRHGKVAARFDETGALEVECRGLTTQAKYYKPLLREFFRKRFRALRPGYGDYSVHIIMHHQGEPPRMDLDNIAKAMNDSLTGHAFEDDSQIARLLVERAPGDHEGIWMRVVALDGGDGA